MKQSYVRASAIRAILRTFLTWWDNRASAFTPLLAIGAERGLPYSWDDPVGEGVSYTHAGR